MTIFIKSVTRIISHKTIGNYHIWFVEYNDSSTARIRVLEPDDGKDEVKIGDSYDEHKENVYA